MGKMWKSYDSSKALNHEESTGSRDSLMSSWKQDQETLLCRIEGYGWFFQEQEE